MRAHRPIILHQSACTTTGCNQGQQDNDISLGVGLTEQHKQFFLIQSFSDCRLALLTHMYKHADKIVRCARDVVPSSFF